MEENTLPEGRDGRAAASESGRAATGVFDDTAQAQPDAGGGGPGPIPVDIEDGHQPWGAALEPVLRRACNDRLGEVTWFRTDWQRGGALTGYAHYHADDDREHEVVVKLPVPPAERRWLERLQAGDDVAPVLYAHGESLNGYDMAWVVMERLAHGPLGATWQGAAFDLLIEAAGRFYAAAEAHPLTGTPREVDWPKVCDQARRAVRTHSLADGQRWNNALKKAQKKLKDWLAVWNDRPIQNWCHGDLHLGNGMTRTPAPQGPALLIDYAQTRPGHWVEDAVYFEHLFWGRRERLEGRKLCRQLAHERKNPGLKVDEHWPQLAGVKRALLAMATPTTLDAAGDPTYVAGALQVLEVEAGV